MKCVIKVFTCVKTCKYAIFCLDEFFNFAQLVYIKALVHMVPKWYATTPDQFCEVNFNKFVYSTTRIRNIWYIEPKPVQAKIVHFVLCKLSQLSLSFRLVFPLHATENAFSGDKPILNKYSFDYPRSKEV